jgi:hypothetical protein
MVAVLFVGLVTGYCGVASATAAGFRRQAGAFCAWDNHNPTAMKNANATMFGDGTGLSFIICAYLDDSLIARSAVTGLSVTMTDGDNTHSAAAAACTESLLTNTVCCGTNPSTGVAFTGFTTLSPSLGCWTGSPSGDFAYLNVTLCNTCGIEGYTTTW